MIYERIYESVLLPRLVRLTPNLYGACFQLMKLMPAKHILENAWERGGLDSGTTVVETTSGTFGLALAMICNIHGWPLKLVSDPIIDATFMRRLVDLGASIDIVRDSRGAGGIQQARLARLAEITAAEPRSFCPSQYSNPDNPESYRRLADFLTDSLGRIDCLVGPVGSGGSMCGTTACLRERCPDTAAVGVDTFGSVIFGQPDGPRLVRGLGNSIMPDNVVHSTFDQVHWIDAATTFDATRLLHRQHSLFMGPTSGAAFLAARWWSAGHPWATTVVLFPDEGNRYLGTVYDDAWLHSLRIVRGTAGTAAPVEVSQPAEKTSGWAYLDWGRRSYGQVVPLEAGGERP